MMSRPDGPRLGVIGGSGMYEMDGLEGIRSLEIDTPFGSPSAPVVTGTIAGVRVGFLTRHGVGHRLLPTEINFRANIYALKTLGVEFVVSASAVGSLKGTIDPLDFVIPDQFIDRTRHRADTFFGDGLVAHVSLADPVCAGLATIVADSARTAGARVHQGGTYVCMEGPQFSTRAESELYRSWGADVIGMTNLQEARLAREAEICYASIAMVTDYDCWNTSEPPVTVDSVIDRLVTNARRARATVADVAGRLPEVRDCPCSRALDGAVITQRDHVPARVIERLAPIVSRVFGAPRP